LLSINQIAPLLGRAYKTVYAAIREVEAAIHRGFPVVWNLLDQTIDGPTQVDESGTVCSGYKGQEPPEAWYEITDAARDLFDQEGLFPDGAWHRQYQAITKTNRIQTLEDLQR